MRWLSRCVVACLIMASAAAPNNNLLRCQYIGSHTCFGNQKGRFYLDDQKVTIKEDRGSFFMDCGKWHALDYEALPRYTRELRVATVTLENCPLPTSRSIVDVLTELNVKLHPSKNKTNLVLNDLRSEPQLTQNHVTGLENLTSLVIKSFGLTQPIDFLATLQSLRSLELASTLIRSGESNASMSLESLMAHGYWPASLETLQLVEWKEKQLAVLGHCNNLSELDLYRPSVKVLPDRWVAACPNLQKITLKAAKHLSSLTSNLLEGATALKVLTITKCMRLTSLPVDFLKGAPNLLTLNLSNNKLKTISSEAFLGPALHSLSLSANRFNNDVLEAVAPMVSLTKLNLGSNTNISNLCDKNGYSSLQNLTHLRELSFWHCSITHICRDWRQSMPYLEYMDLRATDITELTFADLQYTRDASVKKVEVMVDDTYIASVSFTEEDYNRGALRTPPTNTRVTLSWDYDDLKCDCSMYWTRKAMDIPNFTNVISLDQIECSDKTFFKDKTAEQICPERATKKTTN